jgi:hypothetical protein
MVHDPDDQSVSHEPHLQPEGQDLAGKADPSEQAADRTLRYEPARAEGTYREGRSVWDEPDILPGRSDDAIVQDWFCSGCGYNLRGLTAGHPCPECAHVELYRPPPPGAESYGSWLTERVGRTSLEMGWIIAVGAALIGGLWAIVASLLGTQRWGAGGWGMLIMAVVYAPAIEEVMKVAAGAYVVELRPYWFRRTEQIQLATIGAAVVFAVIENLIYLFVYVKNPSGALMAWRWTVCMALHVGCTMLATHGLLDVWQQAVTEYRRPRITRALRTLVPAIGLHGAYNATMMGLELAGVQFLR